MKTLLVLIKRNVKLFFKDKGMFFTSLITPAILLVLYATFLGNVYRDSFTSALPAGVTLPEKLLDGLVAGQLVSSILAVSCVTVSFCSNFLMVQDKAKGSIKDFTISPVSPEKLSIGYYMATLASSLAICLAAMIGCLIYMAFCGWYLTVADVMCMLLDVVLLVFFGTALSSVINFFLSTQGQISAVGSIISSGYGFICGAYMPLSSFSEGLRNTLMLLPGTYGTSLLRTHTMRGALAEMEKSVPGEIVSEFGRVLDCKLFVFGSEVSEAVKYIVLVATVAVLITAYVLINIVRLKKSKK